MAERAANPFSPRVVAAVILGGVAAFLGFIWLMAYAPQLKMKLGEGPTPMSRSAVGFYGLYTLAEKTGRPVDLQSDTRYWSTNGLIIVALTPETDPEQVKAIIEARKDIEGANTLFIFPKWMTMPLPTNGRWVQSLGPIDADWTKELAKAISPDLVLGTGKASKASHITPHYEQDMGGLDVPQPATAAFISKGADPVLCDSDERTVLGRIDIGEDSRAYVLADPDLLSNMALKTPEGARAALIIIDGLRNNTDDSVAFDLAVNGGANKRNLLQLMFEPPFLALTLAVLAAALLVGIHAFNRFGPAVPEPRAIPFGKRALADNAAMLISRAGAARRMGDRYVAMVRDAVATALGAGAMDAEAQERWLASLPQVHGKDFGQLAADARGAQNSEAVRAAAAALYHWRNEVTRDR